MTKQQHIAKANQNETFVGQLDRTSPICRDWCVTILFYVAVHYVEAYFATKVLHYHSHQRRASAIGREGAIVAIYSDYRDLEDFSRKARYDRPVGYFTDVEIQTISDTLARVKAVIAPLL